MNCVDFALVDLQMREIRVMHYAGYGHQSSADYNRCPAALARPSQKPCAPPSSNMRDLTRALDAQNQNLPGRCPTCKKDNPSKLCRFAIMEATKLVDVGGRV
jgi:hypothetical protein